MKQAVFGASIAVAIDSWMERHPYLTSLLITAVVTAVAFATFPALQAPNLDVLYLIAVLVIALRWGERPALLGACVSAVVFDYCFVPPRFSWAMTDFAYLVTLSGFVVVAIVTSRLAAHGRQLLLEQSARERAEALAGAKDLLLHKISHELRAPLTAVVGWTQLLRQVELDREELDRALDGVENGTAILRGLVNDLWDASRAASGRLPVELQPMELTACIASALDVVLPAAEVKGLRLDSRLDRGLHVMGDELRIKQMVTNLVSNAVKFTAPGGSISVVLGRNGNDAELVVRDTGAGIPPEFVPHVFDPFTQADARHSHGGLGLGLSIVTYLAQAHHGTISVWSEGVDRGATFTLKLPLIAGHKDGASDLVTATVGMARAPEAEG